MIYVLTHEYPDKSSFEICGATDSALVAKTWYTASDETNVYEISLNCVPENWMAGLNGWRQVDEKRRREELARERITP